MWPIALIMEWSPLRHVCGPHKTPARKVEREGKYSENFYCAPVLFATHTWRRRKNEVHQPNIFISCCFKVNVRGFLGVFFLLCGLCTVCVAVRFFCWSWVLVHIVFSPWDGVLVGRKGSHYLIMLLILGIRKRCLESLGPDSSCWSCTDSLSPRVRPGDFGSWASSKKQFTTYTVGLQTCLIGVRHRPWMIPYETATLCLR